MKIIKRSGAEMTFDINKITQAVSRANLSVPDSARLNELQVILISDNVKKTCEKMGRALNVEEIQDLVENEIMNQRAFDVEIGRAHV